MEEKGLAKLHIDSELASDIELMDEKSEIYYFS